MKRPRWLLCVLVVVATLAAIGCDDFGHSGGGPSKVNTPDESYTVKKYPISFSGTGTAIEHNEGIDCKEPCSINLVVGANGTCSIYISFPLTIVQFQGKDPVCVKNGETKAWQLDGTYDPVTLDCGFSSCNQSGDYSGYGHIGYGPEYTTSNNVLTCTLDKDGKDKATFNVPRLNVVK